MWKARSLGRCQKSPFCLSLLSLLRTRRNREGFIRISLAFLFESLYSPSRTVVCTVRNNRMIPFFSRIAGRNRDICERGTYKIYNSISIKRNTRAKIVPSSIGGSKKES